MQQNRGHPTIEKCFREGNEIAQVIDSLIFIVKSGGHIPTESLMGILQSQSTYSKILAKLLYKISLSIENQRNPDGTLPPELEPLHDVLLELDNISLSPIGTNARKDKR